MPEESREREETARATPKKDEFVPGTESEEDFEKVLSLLSKWVKGGIVEIDLDPDGDVEFVLPREMRDLFEKEMPRGLKEAQVAKIIRTEIPALVSAGFSKDARNYLRFRLPSNLHGRLDDMAERAQKAVRVLIDRTLKERMLLRRTTLGYVIGSVQSLSGSYESLGGKDEKLNIPFVTLEFSFVRPRAGVTLAMDPSEGVTIVGRKDEINVRVDLHREDVKTLVKDLTKLSEKADA
jgi:hypothetical protein